MKKPNVSPLISRVILAIKDNNLFKPSERLIVGVSGGADSVALLELLIAIPEFQPQIVVAHLNHNLRGTESDEDEVFVRKLSELHALPFELASINIKQLAIETGRSLEEAGREARYDFFEQVRQKYSAEAIAVAHHSDDQAETFLLRVLRGAGTSGLAAMSTKGRNRIIRPLLQTSRKEILDYLNERGITFREDSSNYDQAFLRNRIRHELLPLMNGYNSGIEQRLAKTAQLLGEDEALLEYCTKEKFINTAKTGEGWVGLLRKELIKLPKAMRLRLYRYAVAEINGDLKHFEQLHFILTDHNLLEGKTGTSLNLPRNLVSTLTSEHLLFSDINCLNPPEPQNCTVIYPGRYELGNGLSLLIEEVSAPQRLNSETNSTAYIDSEKAPFPWEVRPFCKGERFELLGMNGSRSIQDILTDRKIPRYLRHALPLVCCENHPLWLAGICRSRHALIGDKSAGIIKISLYGTEKLVLFPVSLGT